MGYRQLAFAPDTRFLVTGGAGFIGSNLCEAILSMGFHVRCLDNLSTGKRENLASFASDSRFSFMEGDIRDLNTCIAACDGVDFVLHEAAWGSVPRSIEMPLFYNENNVQGTLNMLEAARKKGIHKFVYASSSSVYGLTTVFPEVEGKEGPLVSPYALTKHSNEEWAKQYTRHFGLATIGLRYFNVFGRRQNPDGAYAAVIPKFIRQLLAGERPTIHGDGGQSRDFTYVENVIEANLRACLAHEEADGEVFNVAAGGDVTLMQVYRMLCEGLGLNVEPLFGPPRAGDVRHSNADISKARRLLGYSPDFDFAKGLSEALAWYKANL